MARSGILAEVLALPVVRAVALFMALYLGLEVTVGSWTFSVLTEVRGQSMGGAGWTIICYWVGLAAGRLLLGRLAQGQPGPRLIQWCLAGVAAGMLGLWLLPGTAAAVVCLTLTGLCIGPVYPTARRWDGLRQSGNLVRATRGPQAPQRGRGASHKPAGREGRLRV